MRNSAFIAVLVAATASLVVGCKSTKSGQTGTSSPVTGGPSSPSNADGDSSASSNSSSSSTTNASSSTPPPPAIKDCGNQTDFDRDGDGISDPVERNNRRIANFETGKCDKDPSKPIDRPSSGKLAGGLNLPDKGTGYVHFYGTDKVDTDDWATLTMLNCLEAVGRAVRRENLKLNVGDLSLKGGGRFAPHQSHQNGLDADLRYVRKDRREVPLDLRIEPEQYDLDATQAIFEAFFNECDVHSMYVDIDRIGFTISGAEERLIHVRGHSNHFHVRLRGPE